MPERLLYDALSSFGGGVNSDLEPLLLDRNTLSWMVNGTVRGGYAKPRPPIFNREITFPSDEVMGAVLNGLFQGGGYYRPDFGASQLVAQISGRLFAFAISGNVITATEITVPGDPNDSSASQVWMFQAEKWLTVTDGSTKNPIFYDGVTSRRSVGPSVLLAVANTFNPAAPPAIGENVEVTLTTPWTFGFGQMVLMNGQYYRAISSTGLPEVYNIILTNTGATPTDIVPSGSPITIEPGTIAYTNGSSGINNIAPGSCDSDIFVSISIPRSLASAVAIGSQVLFRGNIVVISNKIENTPGTTFLQGCLVSPVPPAGGTGFFPAGERVLSVGASDPTVVVGYTAASFVVPPVDGTVNATMTTEYTGSAGQAVWIAGGSFTIEAGAPPAPTSTLFLENISDTDASNYDATEDILSVPELPPGRMGAYGIGHVALNLIDGHSYIYGDVVGGPSGTATYDYRDAVLKTTENDFLAGGGSFRIPNTGELITSFTIAPVLDASYGQGPLQIGTPISVYTCDIPTSPQAFEDLTNPILTQALIGKGPVSQNGTIIANSDTLYRSGLGFDSLIYGRRDFQTGWGNTPISTEVNRSIEGEDKTLISFTSAATFDNRLLATVQMVSSSRGVYSNGVVALNFDPVSSLRGKAPSIWEGEWEDGNVMQYITGNFSGVERCFQFTYNAETLQIEIWEQLRSDSTEKFDNGTDRITWSIETPCIFHPDKRSADLPIVRLANGKMHLDEVVGVVDVAVQYRPDYSAMWVDWHSFTVSSATPDGYKTPIGLGEPRVSSCATQVNRPSRSGRFFQIRVEVTGQAKICGMEFAACQEPTVLFPAPICS